jgi:hypothetical protein
MGMRTFLWANPADRNMAVDGMIEVTVERLSAATLRFRYLVHGRIDEIALPAPAPPLRVNNLWRTTCFEAFLAPVAAPGYREFNFSPSSQWAAYDFAAYRTGMVEAALPAAPDIALTTTANRLEMAATLSLDLGQDPYRLGVAAIIEARDGTKSHWAASFPGGSSDFHHHSCFGLELPSAPAP